jgi:hypothetical protein
MKKRRDTESRGSVEGGNHAKERKEGRKEDVTRIIPLPKQKRIRVADVDLPFSQGDGEDGSL